MTLPADRLVLFGRLCLIAVVLATALAVIVTLARHGSYGLKPHSSHPAS